MVLHVYYFIVPTNAVVHWNASFLENVFGFVLSNVWSKITLSIVLILIQAYLVNDFVIKHKLSRALSTIPAAIFILYTIWVLESDVFQPILLSNLFCTLSIGSLFNIYKKHLPISSIFNSGLYMAIAAIIYPPYFIYLIVLLLGLFSLRNLALRESLQMVVGMGAPYFIISVILFFLDFDKAQFLNFILVFELPQLAYPFNILELLKPIIVFLLVIFTLVVHNKVKKKKKYDAIKKIELCYWMLLMGLMSTLFMNPLIPEAHLLLISTPLAILLGLLLEAKTNSVIKEFVFLLAVVAVVGFQVLF